jgi:hypothetical protein
MAAGHFSDGVTDQRHSFASWKELRFLDGIKAINWEKALVSLERINE